MFVLYFMLQYVSTTCHLQDKNFFKNTQKVRTLYYPTDAQICNSYVRLELL